jgi:uncharacterized cupredoxin-like copper-binding protein
MNTFIRRAAVAVAVAVLTGSLTACGGSTDTGSGQYGQGMMGGGTVAGSAGAGMMGGDSDYHYSPLTCSPPSSLPGSTVTVALGDMGMTQMMSGTAPLGSHMMLRATPAAVAAGQVSLVASNMGWRTHELVILPLDSGALVGQRVPGPDGKVDEAGSLGEASASCAEGSGDGITAGTVGWTTVTLAPGRYELVCNLENHYADGMYQELVVT